MTAPLPVHGTDLSKWNPDPDLLKAKSAGLQWLIHKATEGATLVDHKYAERRAAAKRANLPFGAYHFARPEGRDAKAEANHLMKVAKPKAGDIVPALDFEVDYRDAEAWCKEWMAELGRLLLLKGLTVPGRGLHYGPDDFGKDYPHYRWVPRYNRDNRRPSVPWDIFQFSGGAEFPGTPSTFPGLGAVDLNTMKPGFSMDPLILRPLKKPLVRRSTTLLAAHISMQFSDGPEAKKRDARKIFTRAKTKNLAWITGTEAGEDELWEILRDAADQHGYRLHRARGNWIAIQKSIIKSGSWKADEVFVAAKEKVVGDGHDRVFPWVTFVHEITGDTMSVAAVHYPTKGRTPQDPNHWVNELYAKKLGEWAREKGRGGALVFVGGDFNMPDTDKRFDLLFDQPLTSAADELGRYENTGHGPIDAIASYDQDLRVEAMVWRVLMDREFPLETDHNYCEAEFKVYALAA